MPHRLLYLMLGCLPAFGLAGQPQADSLRQEMARCLSTWQKSGRLGGADWFTVVDYYAKQRQCDSVMHYAALALAELPPDEAHYGKILVGKGRCYGMTNQPKAAIAHYEQAIGIFERQGNSPERLNDIAVAYNNIGVVYQNQGDLAQAQRHYQLSAKYARLAHADKRLQMVLSNMANIHMMRGEPWRALPLLDSAMVLLGRQPSSEADSAFLIFQYGMAYRDLEKADTAYSFFSRAKDIARRQGDEQILCAATSLMGAEEYKRGQYALSRASLREAQALSLRHDDRWHLCANLTYLAKVFLAEGQVDSAGLYLQGADSLRAQIGSHQMDVLYYHALSDWQAALGNHAAALDSYKRYHAAQDSITGEAKLRSLQNAEEQFALSEAAQAHQQAVIGLQRRFLAVLAVLLILAFVLAGLLLRNRQTLKAQRQALDEQNTQLQHYINELSASNKELERFSYIASHDLKEPIRGILSFANLIRRRYKDAPSEVMDYLSYIERSGRQMQHIVQDVLAFSSVQHVRLEREAVDLRETLEELLLPYRQPDGGRRVAVHYDLACPALHIQRSHLHMILSNLLSNSVKYNEAAEARIALCSRVLPDGGLWLSFSDNGIGIAPEYRDRVFEMFTRLHPRGRYEGSGIGLAIVKKVLSLYGGSIRVEDTGIAGGTCFGIHLPAGMAVYGA